MSTGIEQVRAISDAILVTVGREFPEATVTVTTHALVDTAVRLAMASKEGVSSVEALDALSKIIAAVRRNEREADKREAKEKRDAGKDPEKA